MNTVSAISDPTAAIQTISGNEVNNHQIQSALNYENIIGKPCSIFIISQLQSIRHASEALDVGQIVVVRDSNYILRYAKVIKGTGIGKESRFIQNKDSHDSNDMSLAVNYYQVQVSPEKKIKLLATSIFTLDKISSVMADFKYQPGTEEEQQKAIEKAFRFIAKPYFNLDKIDAVDAEIQKILELNQIVVIGRTPKEGCSYSYGMILSNLGVPIGFNSELYEVYLGKTDEDATLRKVCGINSLKIDRQLSFID